VLSYRGEIADRDYRGEDGKGRFRPGFVEARQRVDRQMRWVRATIAGLVLGLLALGLRRRDEVEAMALSFPAIFCLSNPTFYYWCLLVPVVLVMASRSVQGPALALLLGIALVEASYLLLSRLALFELFQYAFYSAEMGALALLALLVLQRWPAAAAPQPVTKWGRALPPKLAAPPAAPLTGADASGADASGALVAVQEGGERHPLPGEERSS